MLDVDARVREEFERLLPLPDESGADWDTVLARAMKRGASRGGGRGRRRRAHMALTVGALVVAVLLVALAWPSGPDRGGVLERALAAAGDHAVLHVVFRAERPIDAIVDLETGERRNNVYPETELWYDRARGIRYTGRIGDIVVSDDFAASATDARLDTYALLARSYRDALASGRARLVGPGDVDGRAVFWISVWDSSSRSVIDGKVTFHRVAQEVAVSQESYKPVATRSTIDGRPDGLPLQRIVEFETVPADEVEFERPSPRRGDEREPHAFLCCGTEAIELEDARSVIGRQPLGLGDEFRNLPLRRVARVEGQTRKEGEEEWTGTITALELFYGSLNEDGEPDLARPYVRLREAERLHMALVRTAVAPEGKAIIRGSTATATINGLSVAIEASGQTRHPSALVAAVHALEPLGSG
jgi:hypothetical protein